MTTHLIGAHTSTQGGVSAAIDLAEKLNFTAIQIFTKNNNQWKGKILADKEIYSAFKQKCAGQAAKFSWNKTARETLSVYQEVFNTIR